jgi:hypothetical protein
LPILWGFWNNLNCIFFATEILKTGTNGYFIKSNTRPTLVQSPNSISHCNFKSYTSLKVLCTGPHTMAIREALKHYICDYMLGKCLTCSTLAQNMELRSLMSFPTKLQHCNKSNLTRIKW